MQKNIWYFYNMPIIKIPDGLSVKLFEVIRKIFRPSRCDKIEDQERCIPCMKYLNSINQTPSPQWKITDFTTAKMSSANGVGDFQGIILEIVSQLNSRAYGIEIRSLVSEKLKREVHQPQVYAALMRLENLGLLASYIDKEISAGQRGRPRRVYEVTAPGLRMLAARKLLSNGVRHSGEIYGDAEEACPA
jgi:DNA-binding PadR family transcriptional regulator